MERCTIVVGTRDRFSTLIKCLERIRTCTPEPHDLIVVAGGAPEGVRQDWLRRFGDRAKFIFEREFVNQSQARNLACAQRPPGWPCSWTTMYSYGPAGCARSWTASRRRAR
jgi:hypothetical protein